MQAVTLPFIKPILEDFCVFYWKRLNSCPQANVLTVVTSRPEAGRHRSNFGEISMSAYPYALQLYSVRDYLENNPAEGLKRVKDAGYQYVEMAGDYNLAPLALKNLLENTGLIPISMHAGYDQVTERLDTVIRLAQTLMVSYVVVPWLGGDLCPDRDDWLEAAENMDDIGAALGKEGLQLCYHNHDHEFKCYDDETIFDLIFANSDPDNLKVELDLCWAAVGRADVQDLLARYTGRVPLVHVKDCRQPAPDSPVIFTELGNGIMDWGAIMPAARAAGAKWFIVEQDTSEMDSMHSAAANAAFMQRLNQ